MKIRRPDRQAVEDWAASWVLLTFLLRFGTMVMHGRPMGWISSAVTAAVTNTAIRVAGRWGEKWRARKR
ncbi:hypothetical protein [Streptomyces sp. NPDC055105]|uniref:hypothetical protein n=1 Tax=Streptomyces sp. NPDC055105 TaxID=3365719 RepID=UPI0037D5083B